MQVWDVSSGGISAIGRAQTNPNHLMVEYGGEPVFQDGIQEGKADPWGYSTDDVLSILDDDERNRFLTYILGAGSGADSLGALIAGISPGLIGAANTIVVDDEGWYWPGGQRVGTLESYLKSDGVQLVSADASAFYRPRYDITRASRTSVWLAQGFGIVIDDLAAESAHQWRWQAYLRPDITMTDSTARVGLGNDTHVLLAWDDAPQVKTTQVAGYPRTQEGRSCRLDLIKHGTTAAFAVLIAPGAESASIRHRAHDLIEVTIDGVMHTVDVGSLRSANPAQPATSDIHELSDINEDTQEPSAELKSLGTWTSNNVSIPDGPLSAIDACLTQCAAGTPDVALLVSSLDHAEWPVRMAAAEALGHCGCVDALPALRSALAGEHGIPVDMQYPVNPEGPQDPVAAEPKANRWRLKTALIVALGRLKDRESIPLIAKVLADSRDFYPVYSVAAQALGRIGGTDALAALAPALKEMRRRQYPTTRPRRTEGIDRRPCGGDVARHLIFAQLVYESKVTQSCRYVNNTLRCCAISRCRHRHFNPLFSRYTLSCPVGSLTPYRT